MIVSLLLRLIRQFESNMVCNDACLQIRFVEKKFRWITQLTLQTQMIVQPVGSCIVELVRHWIRNGKFEYFHIPFINKNQ